jgi:hypothetical protein
VSSAEYGAISSAPVRDAVLRRLSRYHEALVDSLASDADIVFQIALEKRKWSRLTSAYDHLPGIEQRVFATLALIDRGRNEIELQEYCIRELRKRDLLTVIAEHQLSALYAEQFRREVQLKKLHRKPKLRWAELDE